MMNLDSINVISFFGFRLRQRQFLMNLGSINVVRGCHFNLTGFVLNPIRDDLIENGIVTSSEYNYLKVCSNENCDLSPVTYWGWTDASSTQLTPSSFAKFCRKISNRNCFWDINFYLGIQCYCDQTVDGFCTANGTCFGAYCASSTFKDKGILEPRVH